MSFVFDCDGFIVMTRMSQSPSSSGPLRPEVAPADQVVGRGAEGKDPVDESSAAMSEFAEEADGFHPAEGLLDQLPLALTEGIAGVAHRAPVDGPAAAAMDGGGDVGR